MAGVANSDGVAGVASRILWVTGEGGNDVLPLVRVLGAFDGFFRFFFLFSRITRFHSSLFSSLASEVVSLVTLVLSWVASVVLMVLGVVFSATPGRCAESAVF